MRRAYIVPIIVIMVSIPAHAFPQVKDGSDQKTDLILLSVPGSQRVQKGSAGWVPSYIELDPNHQNVFRSGESNATPLFSHTFPNGDVGLVAKINPDSPSTYIVLNGLPVSLEKLERYLKSTIDTDLLEEPISPYQGRYSLIDSNGRCTQVLTIAQPSGSETPSIVDGQLCFVGCPEEGALLLYQVPGTRIILKKGIISGKKKLMGGDAVLDLVLKDVQVMDDKGNVHIVRNVLYPRLVNQGEKSFSIE